MFDETQEKIINATMKLVMEKGYSSTTTKDIARAAGINECTIFRKFDGKKDIVLSAMELAEWNPNLQATDFVTTGELRVDLQHFANVYMRKVTPQMVRLSIGLRTPELVEATSEGIRKVPQLFKDVLQSYFEEKINAGELKATDAQHLAMMFLSVVFGFVFLDASFGSSLTTLEKEQYVEKSVEIFVDGILRKE